MKRFLMAIAVFVGMSSFAMAADHHPAHHPVHHPVHHHHHHHVVHHRPAHH